MVLGRAVFIVEQSYSRKSNLRRSRVIQDSHFGNLSPQQPSMKEIYESMFKKRKDFKYLNVAGQVVPTT